MRPWSVQRPVAARIHRHLVRRSERSTFPPGVYCGTTGHRKHVRDTSEVDQLPFPPSFHLRHGRGGVVRHGGAMRGHLSRQNLRVAALPSFCVPSGPKRNPMSRETPVLLPWATAGRYRPAECRARPQEEKSPLASALVMNQSTRRGIGLPFLAANLQVGWPTRSTCRDEL